MSAPVKIDSIQLCRVSDLVPNSGVCVLVGEQQIGLFYFPAETPRVYAISNWDPIGKANVLSRGIVGDKDGRLVVASPLYKHHFDLMTGICVEDEQISVKVYPVELSADSVRLL